jgi:hypothetical protein
MRTPLACLAILLAGPAAAQSPEWTFAGSLYGWFSGMDASVDTPRGTVDASLSFSDVFSDLDMTFMGAFEARHAKWSLIGDLVYTDLSASEDTPFGLAFSSAEVKTKMTIFSGYAAYRVYETEQVAVDLAGGVRWFWMDTDTSLKPGLLDEENFSARGNWGDPLIAARVIVPFNEKWYGTAFADAGGFLSDDSSTWQAFASIGYRFNERWSTQLGYRYMSIDKTVDGEDVDLDLYGPLIGVTARF